MLLRTSSLPGVDESQAVNRLPSCRFIGVVPVPGDVEAWFARLRRVGLNPVALGTCLIATDAALTPPVSDGSRLTFVLGGIRGNRCDSLSSLHSLARVSDDAAFIQVDRRRRRVRLFRAWTGATPLYFALVRGTVVFSTRLALLLSCQTASQSIRAVGPGTECDISRSTLAHRCMRAQEITRPMRVPRNREKLIRLVQRLVVASVHRFTADRAIVLLSGGVDSTILAYLLKRRVRQLEAVVVSIDSARDADSASDLYMARQAASWLGIHLHEVMVSPGDAIGVVPEVIRLSETRRASIVDELSGMYFLARHVRSLGFAYAYTGEGPDDIFGGLEFQLRFTPLHRLHDAMRRNFEEELPTELAAHQKLFTDAAGVTLIHPFLYRPLVRMAFNLPPRQLVDRPRRMKLLLRQAFAAAIPREFVWRDKAITRVASGLKRVQEAHFGAKPTRYYGLYRTWLNSLTAP